jgi:hypothetical protein
MASPAPVTTPDWALRQATTFLGLDRASGTSPASCPYDAYVLRRECPCCLAELLRQVAREVAR